MKYYRFVILLFLCLIYAGIAAAAAEDYGALSPVMSHQCDADPGIVSDLSNDESITVFRDERWQMDFAERQGKIKNQAIFAEIGETASAGRQGSFQFNLLLSIKTDLRI